MSTTTMKQPPTNMSVAHFDGHDNGPILYDNLNRTSAIDDIRSVVIYIFIITIFFSFFLILPGIRNSKFSTFVCILTSLLVTSIIVISLNGTTWQVGETSISAPYMAFPPYQIQGDLGIRIGLQSVNITLKAHNHLSTKRVYGDINYNERFYWIEPMQMGREYNQALQRGLPYPILTVAEYLSQDEAGFNWSRQYRAAGYYTSMLLWLSASVCVLMFALHCAAPKYGIYAMQALGVLLLLANLNYATLVPRGDQELVIRLKDQRLTLRFGWNFWLVLVGGCLSLSVGTIIVIIDRIFPNFIFTTVLDVDFDTMTQKTYNERKYKILSRQMTDQDDDENVAGTDHDKTISSYTKPDLPPFIRELKQKSKNKKRNSEKQQQQLQAVDSKSNKKIARTALGVKLNQTLTDESSETNLSRYEPTVKPHQSVAPAERNDELSKRKSQVGFNEELINDRYVITPDEQNIKL